MRTGNRAWRAAVVGGLVWVAGCDKPGPPQAKSPPATPTEPTPTPPSAAPTTPPQPLVIPPPVIGPMPTPVIPATPAVGQPPANPLPASPFAPPTPALKPDIASPAPAGQAPPATPPVLADPLPLPGATTPPPPPPAGTPPANPPTGAKPPEPRYPDEINAKKLDWYLGQMSFRTQRDPQLRESAVRTLPLFGPAACKPSIKPLIAVIEGDPDPGVRIAAITMISSMGFEHRNEVKPAVETLRRIIGQTGRGSALRAYCVRSIESFGPDAAAAVPELRAISTAEAEPSWETRMAVAEALGYIGAPPKPGTSPNVLAVKTLLERVLEDPCLSVRLEATKSLLAMGPPQTKNPDEYKKEVAPYLVLLQKHLDAEKGRNGDKGVYVWLVLLQVMYDDRTTPENLKVITRLVKEPEGGKDSTGTPAAMVRMYAIQAIGVLGPQFAAMRTNPALQQPAEAAIQSVIDALNYPEQPLQVTAMMCLARIGNEARKAVPELEKIKAKLPVKPIGAPADFKPDDTLQRTAADAIDYIVGKKKFDDGPKKEEKKDDKKDTK